MQKENSEENILYGKYVICDGMPVLFPMELRHNKVAVNEVTRAGFYLIRRNRDTGVIEVVCSGFSSSLGVGSSPVKDAKLIREHFYKVVAA